MIITWRRANLILEGISSINVDVQKVSLIFTEMQAGYIYCNKLKNRPIDSSC